MTFACAHFIGVGLSISGIFCGKLLLFKSMKISLEICMSGYMVEEEIINTIVLLSQFGYA